MQPQQPTQTLIGPTMDPTQQLIIDMPTFSGPLDPHAPIFDAAYWASQHPRVQALQNMDTGPTKGDDGTEHYLRREAATELANEGFLIDYIIMGEGAGPYAEMQGTRVPAGYTWVGNALQEPIPVAPRIHVPGLPDYNPKPPFPADTIPVSNNAACYLPYQAPASVSQG